MTGDKTYVLKMNNNWILLLQVESLGCNKSYSSTTYRVEDVIYSINRDIEIGIKVTDKYEIQDWPISTDMSIINRQIIDLIFKLL